MMDMLLWRCPVCATNDTLVHRRRLFRPERVWCQACSTAWQVRRVPGKDYRLRVVAGPSALLGIELPLAEWYDRMKAGVTLVPRQDVALGLAAGEEGYLCSGRVRLFALPDDPAFFGTRAQDGAEAVQGRPQVVGWGQLVLTSERLVWRGLGGPYDFWLQRLTHVYALYNIALSIRYQGKSYQFRFRDESFLKWLTYIAKAGERIKEMYGHPITTAHF